MKKHLIKIGALLTTCLSFPLSVIADTSSVNIQTSLENSTEDLNPSLLTRQRFNRKDRCCKEALRIAREARVRSLTFTAASIYVIKGSGSTFRSFLSAEISIPSITLPSTGSPAAAVGFKMPIDFDPLLHSELNIKFLTDSELTPITGNVAFTVQIEAVQPGETLDRTSETIGNTKLVSVESAPPTTLGVSPKNYYTSRIRTRGAFRKGDFVYLVVARDNSTINNYESDISLIGFQLNYNLPQKR